MAGMRSEQRRGMARARRLAARMARGQRIPERWRRAHRLYAALYGFGWLPCPLCGLLFSGHEWRDIGGRSSVLLYLGRPHEGTAICPQCTRSGRGDGWVCAR
jgi:hypothetical protein